MSQVPASLLRPSIGRLELGLPRRRRTLMTVMLINIVVGILGMGAIIGYLLSTHREAVLLYAYPRADLQPGALVNERYSIAWFALTFAAAHTILYAMLLWSLKNIVITWKRYVHLFMSGAFLLVDFVILLILLVVSCFFCNNTLSAGSFCNDPDRYCLAFPDTAQCPPLAVNTTALDPINLTPNTAFTGLSIWLLVFLGLDLINAILNSFTATAVRKFISQTQGYGYVRF